ncbi:ATP-binding protein [Kitasatospora paranensis]|uniref:ATP-binding protein n=1 Tax=Kitasatospora paranensis TaxID=258053 RepID=A0ABW2G3Q8_9ACTN
MSADQHARSGQTQGKTPPEGPLRERDAELDAADHAVSRLCHKFAAGGTEIGEVLLFSGPGGMGKTSLLDQVRRLAGLRPRCTVLFARGGERQRNEPFHVLRQLLQPVLGALSESERNEVFGSWYGIVGPAIGLVPPSDELEPLDPQGVRDGLDFVFTQLAPRLAPLVLVVDDLHWADQESLSWLAAFAVRSRELPVLLVLAYRDEFDYPALTFRQQIESIAKYRHELRRLTPDTVADLVRAELGRSADDAFCRQVWAVTGGIPFDIGALLREVRDQGLEPSEENARELHDLAAAARGETLQHWLDKLGPTTLHFAWACALLGTDIRQPLAATIAGQGPDQADDSVRKLRKQRVLTSQPNGRLEFVHPLIGTSIYLTMPAGTKTAMHGMAAAAIENAGGTLLAASRHLLEVHCEGDDSIVRKLRKAAQEHLAIGAPDAAKRCLERALKEPPDDDVKAEVIYELGCSALLTDPVATVNQLRLALEMDPGLREELRVDATFRLSEALARSGELTEAADVCQEEAERTAAGPGRLRLQAAHFMWAAFQRDEADGPARSQRLKELSESLTGRGSAELAVLAMRAWDLTLRGEPAVHALELADKALVAGRLPTDLGWTGTTWGFELPALIGLTLTYTDELARAEKLFSDAIMEFEVAGWSGAHRGFAYFLMGLVRFRRGFLLEAEDFLRRGLRISERIAPDLPLQWDIVGVLADTLLARGRVDEAWELAEQYRFAPPYHATAMVLPDAPTLYGKLLLARGRRAEAVDELTRVGEQLDGRGWHNTVWASWAGHLAVAVAPDDPDGARKYAETAVDRAREFGTPSAVGAALRLQAAVHEGPRAIELLEEAVAVLGQSPAGHEHAHALVDLGAALRRSGRLTDAEEYLYQAIELAQSCGADGLLARARHELDLSNSRPNRLRTLSKDALSPAEWDVAQLAVQGLPPQRISDRLKVPPSLVHRRLAAVHRKAGTGPEGLAAALGLPEQAPEASDEQTAATEGEAADREG